MNYKRLKKSGDFSRLFKSGKRVYSPCLTLIYSPSRKDTVMGIALSKKHGKAVKRNRIKRLIRAAFSRNIGALSGKFYVVIMPKISEEYCYRDMEKSLLACFKRMNNDAKA